MSVACPDEKPAGPRLTQQVAVAVGVEEGVAVGVRVGVEVGVEVATVPVVVGVEEGVVVAVWAGVEVGFPLAGLLGFEGEFLAGQPDNNAPPKMTDNSTTPLMDVPFMGRLLEI